jgi:U4/U6 small nuclear ribonucleoprotein PRP4
MSSQQQLQQAGQQNVAGQIEVMNFSESSVLQRQKHEGVLLDLEAKKIAATVDVPTLPAQVRMSLRQMGMPVRLFGENLANVRDRLRMELARQQVSADFLVGREQHAATAGVGTGEEQEEEEEVTKYTNAPQALIEARQAIATFSLQRAAKRLETERRLRAQAKRKRSSSSAAATVTVAAANDGDTGSGDTKAPAETELSRLDQQCTKTYKTLRQAALDGSQYGDSRPLSCISTLTIAGMPVVVTASWSGTIHLWDGSSPALQALGQKTMCHEDRIMGMDTLSLGDNNGDTNTNSETALIATTSIDLTAKIFKVRKSNVVMTDANDHDADASTPEQFFGITETTQLKGHAARLCRAAFHPMKKHVVTTSFDHTWRLWDIETGQDLLLQDGHWKECYGIGFHPDGSLCSTTDFAGVVHVWDLRTGKSIKHFLGHAKRVLNAEFHPNGFQLATAGDDGTIKIWDLRRRKQMASLPAHSNLVTKLCFASSGEYLASSSFDGTAKLWSCRDWKMLNQFQGHEGKVTGVALLDNHTVVTSGFDKTLKMWR